MAELVFSQPPAVDGALVFGGEAVEIPAEPERPGALVFSRPATTSSALVFGELDDDAPEIPAVPVALAFALPGLAVAIRARYVSDTSRPVVGEVRARYQDADARGVSLAQRWQDAPPVHPATAARFQAGQAMPAASSAGWREALRLQGETAARFQDGQAVGAEAAARFQEARRTSRATSTAFEDALQLHGGAWARFQDALRGLPPELRARWQRGLARRLGVQAFEGYAIAREAGWSTRWQDAIGPPPGETKLGPVKPVEPGKPCYTPSGALVFEVPASSSAALVFVCDGQVVDPVEPDPPASLVIVPIRSRYIVFNSASLRRVDGDIAIPLTSLSLSLDADSWTWSMSARVPGSALPLLEPGASSGPVEVEARVNGVAYRWIVESLARDRSYGRSDLAVGGRGLAAVLDAPYVPAQIFTNAAPRTAQQLAADVLTINGVSIGWDLAWSPEDWLVPAGTWSHQGTYVSALNAIAGAAGAYLQPHRTQRRLAVLPRYPAAPWTWSSVVPDYELPADVVSRESITWRDRPNYNRVFVSGQDAAGVLGIATRAGTAGDIEAPMITDPLITSDVAARQRALPVLSDVGRQAEVQLRMPVLPETGIIVPGKFVRYVDAGVSRVGLVRTSSTSVERTDESLAIWQTIGVETHVTQ